MTTTNDDAAQRIAAICARLGSGTPRVASPAAQLVRPVPADEARARIAAIAARHGAAPPPPPPSKRDAAARRRAEHVAAVRAAGGAHYNPTDWRVDVRQLVVAILRSPARARDAVAALPRHAARIVRTVALGVTRGPAGWTARRSWWSSAARNIAAVACALWHQARSSSRGGFTRVCAGVSTRMLGALWRPVLGHSLSQSYLCGTSVGRAGEPGLLQQLARAGLWLQTQPPASVTPQHAGPPKRGVRYAFSQYRFVGAWLLPEPQDGEDDALASVSAAAACIAPQRDPYPAPA